MRQPVIPERTAQRSWRLLSTRPLPVPRADAVGWDIPFGYVDDPPELTGRAALAARYLAHALAQPAPGGAAGTQGWIRRHALREHTSSFSFWSPHATAEAVATSVARLDIAPPPSRLRALAEAQLKQVRIQQASAHAVLFRRMEEAAWGRAAMGASGSAETLEAVLASDMASYLRRCHEEGWIVAPGGPLPEEHRASERPTWRGELVCADRPGLQCRVAAQYVLDPDLASIAYLYVLSEYLDGPDGLVERRMRAEAGISYGAIGLPREDGNVLSIVIGVGMLVDDLPKGIRKLAELVDEINFGVLDPDLLEQARLRAHHKILDRLDGPFGSLDDHRRRSLGQRPISEALADLPSVLERMEARPRFSVHHRPGVCFLGTYDGARELLEGTLW